MKKLMLALFIVALGVGGSILVIKKARTGSSGYELQNLCEKCNKPKKNCGCKKKLSAETCSMCKQPKSKCSCGYNKVKPLGKTCGTGDDEEDEGITKFGKTCGTGDDEEDEGTKKLGKTCGTGDDEEDEGTKKLGCGCGDKDQKCDCPEGQCTCGDKKAEKLGEGCGVGDDEDEERAF